MGARKIAGFRLLTNGSVCWLAWSLLALAGCSDDVTVVASGDPAVPTEMSVTVSNVKDGGTIHSGFLTGLAADGSSSTVTGVEVSLDSGAFQPASGTGSWIFALPTGTATWRDGSSHTIDVRATDGAGNLSPVTALTVRKGVNNDVNGDGTADLAVGASSGAGVTYVFHGSPTGVPGGDATTAATTLTGKANSSFGTSVALGDVNGDGYADLAVGAFLISSFAGEAYVFHGSATGVPSGAATTAATTLTGTTSSQFGISVALGDVNGDGTADLAVGADRAIILTDIVGAAYVFHGSATGIPDGDTTAAATTLEGPAVNSSFGNSVALGDVNGDGTADLAVGARNASLNAGAAYVFHGSAVGVPGGNTNSAATTLTGTGNQFGISVALGDVHGDGYADLVVGASGGNGAASMFNGSATGVLVALSAATTVTGLANSGFGISVALGDVNGDGYADLAVGAQAGAGVAYVFHGAATGVRGGDPATTLTGPATSNFGLSVAL